MNLIWIKDYPITIKFKTKEALPEFKYGCQVRTKILRKELKPFIKDIQLSVPHEISDFIVENISTIRNGEIWHVGS